MKLRSRWLKIILISTTVIITFIAIKTIYISSTFKPQSIFKVPFRERAQSKFDDDVRVTATVLSAEESRQIFGVNLAKKGIQPVWIRVENHDTRPYWLMYSGLDPNYFSPIEAAQVNHSIFTKSLNTKIEEHFRVLGFRNPIASGASVSGFIYANLDEGTKVVDIRLLRFNTSGFGKTKFFTFFLPVPGIKADYYDVDFERLYTSSEIVDLDEKELRIALENLPCCTTDEDGTQQGDPLNLVLIGTREVIASAFIRRGWLAAEETYGKAIWKTVKSFLLGSKYLYSPVSPLYLYSRQQDRAGQKPRQTVHQRNHLRLWLSPMRHKGLPVWIGQISRDVGVRFTLKIWPPVTHKIDSDIDEALHALLEDMVYSQQLATVGWVKGVGAASRSKPRHNLTGDPYFTFGLRLVLMFEKTPPRASENIQSFFWEESPESSMLKRLKTDRIPDFDEMR